jgi:hypothetical protein
MIILGMAFSKAAVYNFSGLFGGLFPCIFDLIQRSKVNAQQKIKLNLEFWLVKAVLLPLAALIITALSVSTENINSWFAALYLGATFPALVEKLVSISSKDIQLPVDA